MRKKTALTIGLVILGCFLGLAGLVVCGLVFIEKAFRLPEVITAEYPGIRLWGRETDGEWIFTELFVTPSDSLDAKGAELAKGLLVRLGQQDPVPIREVTPEIIDEYRKAANLSLTPTTPDGENWIPGTCTIEFRDGVVRSARYSRSSKSVLFIKGEKEFRLPISRKDFESMFGKPTTVKITEDHWR